MDDAPPSDDSSSSSDMSYAKIQLKYDGPELQAHEMDVTILAPALLSFGELCTEANRVLNGDRAKVRVMMNADVKANCITVDLTVVQHIWDSIKSLMNNGDFVSAKTLLETIGLLGGAGGLIKFLLWKKDRKEEKATTTIVNNGNMVVVQVQGDNNTTTIPENVYKLSKSTKIVESIKEVVKPVRIENGIDDATIIYDKKEQVKIDQETAEALQKTHAENESSVTQTITAHAVIHAPVLDHKAKQWKFKLSNHVVPIDISETDIAKNALERGEIFVGDTYKLKLEMTERKKPNGSYVTEYKAKEVMEFMQGNMPHPMELPFTPPSSTPDKSKPLPPPTS